MPPKSVNRSLKNETFNQMDHALGRPVNPMSDSHSYRNFFSVSFDSPIGQKMDASPYWERVSSSDGSVTGFCVNEDGRRALCEHLIEIGDRHKVFDVYIDTGKLGLDPCNRPMEVVAETRGKAKSKAWRDISDAFEGITFTQFMRAITSVRISEQIDLSPEAPGMAP
jgi:hypothetical protein